jgi:hypothetical protein
MKLLIRKTLVILLVALFVLLGVSLYIVSKLLFYSDLSERVVDTKSKFTNTYLISYASGPELFSRNQRFLAYSGLAQNIRFI